MPKARKPPQVKPQQLVVEAFILLKILVRVVSDAKTEEIILY